MCLYMIQKQTYLQITDSTNGRWCQVFHLYKGSFRRYSYNGLIVKVAIKIVKAPLLYYKGLRVRLIRKGQRRRGLINFVNIAYTRNCGFTYRGYTNSTLLFGKRKQFKGKRIVGLSLRNNMKQKYLNIIKNII